MKTFVKVMTIDSDSVSAVEDLAAIVERLVNEIVETFDIKITDVTVTSVQVHDSLYEGQRIYNFTDTGWIVTVLYKANGPIKD